MRLLSYDPACSGTAGKSSLSLSLSLVRPVSNDRKSPLTRRGPNVTTKEREFRRCRLTRCIFDFPPATKSQCLLQVFFNEITSEIFILGNTSSRLLWQTSPTRNSRSVCQAFFAFAIRVVEQRLWVHDRVVFEKTTRLVCVTALEFQNNAGSSPIYFGTASQTKSGLQLSTPESNCRPSRTTAPASFQPQKDISPPACPPLSPSMLCVLPLFDTFLYPPTSSLSGLLRTLSPGQAPFHAGHSGRSRAEIESEAIASRAPKQSATAPPPRVEKESKAVARRAPEQPATRRARAPPW